MVTFVMSVQARLNKRFCIGLGLWCFICCFPIKAQLTSTSRSAQLYLLAATTTEHTPQSYAALLYRVGPNRKLDLVRQVVSQMDGVRFVYAWEDAIFLLYPHIMPTSVAIIHCAEPMLADSVLFSSQGVYTDSVDATVAEQPNSSEVLLVPWLSDISDPPHIKVSLTSILGNLTPGKERIGLGDWNLYSALRWGGVPGGPNYSPGLMAAALGDNLAINIFGHETIVDKLPPMLHGTNPQIKPYIAAASQRYVLSTVPHTTTELNSGKFKSLTLFVHERSKDRWSTVQTEGNSGLIRFFEPWLTTIVGTWDRNHGANPGRDNERSEQQKTDRLPPVQTLYRSFVGGSYILPGVLILQNLTDGRKIEIKTGQEDSEILWIGNDLLLYRVNDSIYEARIVGDKLQNTALVAKDDDVPEVHWVFWSK